MKKPFNYWYQSNDDGLIIESDCYDCIVRKAKTETGKIYIYKAGVRGFINIINGKDSETKK